MTKYGRGAKHQVTKKVTRHSLVGGTSSTAVRQRLRMDLKTRQVRSLACLLPPSTGLRRALPTGLLCCVLRASSTSLASHNPTLPYSIAFARNRNANYIAAEAIEAVPTRVRQ